MRLFLVSDFLLKPAFLPEALFLYLYIIHGEILEAPETTAFLKHSSLLTQRWLHGALHHRLRSWLHLATYEYIAGTAE